MNFNSLQFLIFLAVVLLLYWLLPHKVRWILLLVASYFFYMSWNPWLVFLILGTTVISYGAALAIAKTEKKSLKKFWLVFTLVVCLGVLFVFKYLDFTIQSVVDFFNLFSLNLDGFAFNLLLPVGISFYTFQTLSYVIDVYRGDIAPERHFGYYALFVCYFPQLVAGPIERADNLIPQLKAPHAINADDMYSGLRIFLYGFFLKCVIADFCGIFVNNVFSDTANATSLSVFISGLLFTLQMFGDFAGYSLIATGTARMMGVRLTRNFDRPYLATSYTDFFHRWHITLTRWFTDYLYIPLGGSRKGKCRRVLNTFIVFFLCGLWHGANWTYVLWGMYAAFFISVESLLRGAAGRFFKKRNIDCNGTMFTFFRRVIMWIIFVPAAIIFRSVSVAQAGDMFLILFTGFGNYFGGAVANLGFTPIIIAQLAVSIICMALLWRFVEYEPVKPPVFLNKIAGRSVYAQRVSVYFYVILAVGVFWLALLVSDNASVFLYFQF